MRRNDISVAACDREREGFCIVVIACGGRTCTAAMLAEWAVKLGV